MTMKNVSEVDQETMASLLKEAKMPLGDEAIAIIIETAYCLGRGTGFRECSAMTKEIIGRTSLSESEVRGG